MARIRTIKPVLFSGYTASSWPDAVFRTFAGLLCYVDDKGRGEDDADLIKADIAPRVKRITPAKISAHMDLLEACETLCRYDGDDGRRYFHLVNFGRDQRINRPTKSVIQPCPKHEEEGLF